MKNIIARKLKIYPNMLASVSTGLSISGDKHEQLSVLFTQVLIIYLAIVLITSTQCRTRHVAPAVLQANRNLSVCKFHRLMGGVVSKGRQTSSFLTNQMPTAVLRVIEFHLDRWACCRLFDIFLFYFQKIEFQMHCSCKRFRSSNKVT